MKSPFGNRRGTSKGRRKQQHLLDVRMRGAKVREQRNRRILTAISLLVLVGGAVAGIYFGVHEGLRRFVWENPDYKLSSIEVKTDGSLSREQALEASCLRPGRNIFTVDLSRVRESLSRIPQVETVEVRRLLPDKIAIDICERHPVAWVTSKRDEVPSAQAGSFLLDRKGVMIQCRNLPAEYFHLPIITGVPATELEAGQQLQSPEIRAALDLIRLNADGPSQARFQVTSIDVSQGYCLAATTRNHARITFGLERLDWQIERLTTLLEHIEQGRRELQSVNLMVQRNIPVTFMPADDAPSDAGEAKPAPAKPEKPAPAVSKNSQANGRKHSPPGKKKQAEPGRAHGEKPVMKAIPVNTSGIKSNG